MTRRFLSMKGYSLIELILVVSALLLIAAFGLARYNEFTERQTVQQTTDSFISNLRLIQAKALAGEKPENCETLVGWTVEFGLKQYSMYAICRNGGVEEIMEETRVTVDLPGNVNLSPSSGVLTYYALGKGTSQDPSGDLDVSIIGKSITVPVVLSASGSIVKETQVETTVAVASPTPTPVTCVWPAGDPRCDDIEESTPTPTFESQTAEFACQVAGGTWQNYQFGSCPDLCAYVGIEHLIGACEPGYACNCGAAQCWDGATCVDNPMCGGIQGIICPEGYFCFYGDGDKGQDPDASGICVQQVPK